MILQVQVTVKEYEPWCPPRPGALPDNTPNRKLRSTRSYWRDARPIDAEKLGLGPTTFKAHRLNGT